MPARLVGNITGLLFSVANLLLGSSLPLVLVAANENGGIAGGATPTTIIAAFITVSVGCFTLLGWTLKRLLEINREQAKDHKEEVAGFVKELQLLRESHIDEMKNLVSQSLRERHQEPQRVP